MTNLNFKHISTSKYIFFYRFTLSDPSIRKSNKRSMVAFSFILGWTEFQTAFNEMTTRYCSIENPSGFWKELV
jgi:hypothetical protein